MAELSPAAQSVWDAFNQDEAGVFVDYGDKLAAALRAAADQVVPLRARTPWESPVYPSTEALCIHAAIYSIAAELDS